MPTDCDVNQESEPIWVFLIQSAMYYRFASITEVNLKGYPRIENKDIELKIR